MFELKPSGLKCVDWNFYGKGIIFRILSFVMKEMCELLTGHMVTLAVVSNL